MTTTDHLRNACLPVLGACLLTAATTGWSQTYSVQDLGVFSDLPGQALSHPNAINSAGHVVAANVTGGQYRALLWGGAWTNLGTLGGNESLGFGINASNQVVGSSRNASGFRRAFLWTPGGTGGVPANPQMQDLGTFGGDESEAADINAVGQITGYAQTTNRDHAFRRTGTTLLDLGALLSWAHSYGAAINDAGHVVGIAYNNNWNTWRAFFFDGTNAVDLGAFGGQNSAALDINNHDQIVGYYTTAAGVDHAFRYAAGVMTDLGTLGGQWSYAHAINNSNVIVGGSFVDASNTQYRAFLWANGSMVNLNTRLDASGAGWTLVEAFDLNDSGQIVGLGYYGGATHGFLLTPLAPPQITQQPTHLTVPCSSNATFTVRAAPEPLAYRWFKGTPPSGTAVPGGVSNTLVLTNVTGAHAGSYYAVVSNAAGSVTSAVATLTVPDSTPPVLSGCPADRTNNTAFNRCTAVVSWSPPTAVDNCDGVVPVTCFPPSGSTFNKGVTVVVCEAHDANGNTNTCAFTVTVQDRQLPAMTGCLSPITTNTTPGACSVVVTWTNPTALDNCDGVVNVVCNPPSGFNFPRGVRTVTCRAADSSLNTNSCSFNVTVLDAEPPTISGCPPPQTNYLAPGATTAVVTWANPTATDNCGGTVPVICTPTNGSAFPAGVTWVTCRASDASQNSNTCAFPVTIIELPAPQIVGVELRGPDVLIRFTTAHGALYSVEGSATLLPDSWSTVISDLPGNGGVTTATNAGAASQPYRFYRVRRRRRPLGQVSSRSRADPNRN